jgi:hypothetical protein
LLAPKKREHKMTRTFKRKPKVLTLTSHSDIASHIEKEYKDIYDRVVLIAHLKDLPSRLLYARKIKRIEVSSFQGDTLHPNLIRFLLSRKDVKLKIRCDTITKKDHSLHLKQLENSFPCTKEYIELAKKEQILRESLPLPIFEEIAEHLN